MKVKKFFGGPGTGKTTALIGELMKEADVVPLNRICYITFTRAAKREVLDRVKQRFPNAEKNDLLNFHTQHGICFRLLGLKKEQIIDSEDKAAICSDYGIEYLPEDGGSDDDISDFSENGSEGGKLFGCFNKIRLSGMVVNYETLSLLLRQANSRLSSGEAFSVWVEYQKHKRETDKLDFTDMLLNVLEERLCPNMDVLFADEFQDFGKLQYDVYRMWADKAQRVYVAGDDDQSIYTFLAASPEFMLSEVGEEIVLPTNYRTPANIYSYAKALVKRNITRKEKNIVCVNDGGDVVHISSDIIGEDFFERMRSCDARRFFLLRTNYYSQMLADLFIRNGIPFANLHSGTSWSHNLLQINNCVARAQNGQAIPFAEIKEFVVALPSSNILRRGAKKELEEIWVNDSMMFEDWKNKYFSLNGISMGMDELIPFLRITGKQKAIMKAQQSVGFSIISGITNYIGTMHSSKGLEADEVYLFDSLPGKVRAELLETDTLEAERRLYYVACTRARKKLFIIYDFVPKAGSFLREYA